MNALSHLASSIPLCSLLRPRVLSLVLSTKMAPPMHRQKVKKLPAERAWSALRAATEAAEAEAVAQLPQLKRAKLHADDDAAADALPRKSRSIGFGDAARTAGGGHKRQRLQEHQPTGRRTNATLAVDDDAAEQQEETAAPQPASSGASALLSDVRFSSLNISPGTKQVMAQVFGYEFCTLVQAQTIGHLLTGADVVAKAKTGSGKTLAFMIPAIEALIANPQRKGQVGVLVLSPTRELAAQIHTEAEKLLQPQRMTVQMAIGGTSMSTQLRKLQDKVPDVLVATPGRCLDLLENSDLAGMTRSLRIFILDEADNILDMGFRPTLDKIIARLPNKSERQTMLFSATFPVNVKELAAYACRPSHKIVDTVGQESNTNVQVEQFKVVVAHEDLMPRLAAIIKEHIQQEPNYKVIAFFPTARMTQLYSETFQHMRLGSVLEIHSRKSQAYRTRISNEFRQSSQLCMFTSDVSARGVDYPEVTLVIQVGMPTDKAQYVHRVGRTARAGKSGQTILLLGEYEQKFLKQLSDLPLLDMPATARSHTEEAPLVKAALAKVSPLTKAQAYQAWLGFYKDQSPLKPSTPASIVKLANDFSRIIGCPEPPELEAKTVGKMGLKNVPGLRIMGRSAPPQGQHQGRGRPSDAAAPLHGTSRHSTPRHATPHHTHHP